MVLSIEPLSQPPPPRSYTSIGGEGGSWRTGWRGQGTGGGGGHSDPQPPPKNLLGPWEGGGGGGGSVSSGAGGGGESRVPQHKIPQNGPVVALIILNTHLWGFVKTNVPPGGLVAAAGFGGEWGRGWTGGGGEGGGGVKGFFPFYMHIGVPHNSLIIFGAYTRRVKSIR